MMSTWASFLQLCPTSAGTSRGSLALRVIDGSGEGPAVQMEVASLICSF